MNAKRQHCKDCAAVWGRLGIPDRPAPYPGPRCATHHREAEKARKARAAERRDGKVYGLASGEYDALYAHQGGVCAICQRATGKTRRLSVDHDHRTGRVRGLLCRPCNTMLGHARDDVQFFARAVDYLNWSPYTHMKELEQCDDT